MRKPVVQRKKTIWKITCSCAMTDREEFVDLEFELLRLPKNDKLLIQRLQKEYDPKKEEYVIMFVKDKIETNKYYEMDEEEYMKHARDITQQVLEKQRRKEECEEPEAQIHIESNSDNDETIFINYD